MTKTRSAVVMFCAAGLAVLIGAGPAGAADRSRDFGFQGWGPRVGISFSPDQVFVGGHVDFGEPVAHVRFQPNMEVGFGDHLTMWHFDADFHFRFVESWDIWSPYAGGGIGFVYSSANVGPFSDSNSDSEVHAIGGVEKYTESGKFFGEVKIGFNDRPDWKFLVGWTFRQ